jgi:hypothetical protein
MAWNCLARSAVKSDGEVPMANTWDAQHGEIEVFNARGRHLGVLHPLTGELIKEAVRGRKIDV